MPSSSIREPVGSMPGVDRISADVAADEAARLADLGVGGVLLFGLPEQKDETGAAAWRTQLDSAPSPMAASADRIFFATASGAVCALRLADGPHW